MIELRMEEYRKPLPLPDADSKPFWESCRQHAMKLQQCSSCGQFRYPPRSLCPRCHDPRAEWNEVGGKGTVYVALTMCRSPGPVWEADVPYNVSLIELDEGVRLWSNVVGCAPDQVQIGDRVMVHYEDATEAVALPKFQRIT